MATLKISELSVGDWVSCEDVYCKVAYILPNGIIGTTCRNDRDGYEDPLTNLRPIPITAEILERNGFEFEKASRWHICELEDETRINVWIGKNNEGRIEVSKPAPFDDGYHFKYADIVVLNIAVHQLQHVLRLAGLDKEINL